MLIEALLDPRRTRHFSARDWHRVLLQAREHGLLAKLDARLTAADLFAPAPYKARAHLHAARIAVASSQTAVRFEVNRILRALGGTDMPLLLMKGAAYLHAGLPPAAGRFVGDVDLMVPRARIDELEQLLAGRGWACAELDSYDQRYYREWTHEIPPMQHPERDTPVDIHHTIAPLTSRVHPDAAAILAASLPLSDPRLRVMAPADMVLHSAVHLFNDEVSMPLRDLFDLHDLLCHFGPDPVFWDRLLERARLHGLQRVLYHLLRHSRQLLGTPVPPRMLDATAHAAPSLMVRPLIGGLLQRQFAPVARPGDAMAKGLAAHLLYLRAHWLRMPVRLLLPHLAHKTFKRWRGAEGGST